MKYINILFFSLKRSKQLNFFHEQVIFLFVLTFVSKKTIIKYQKLSLL